MFLLYQKLWEATSNRDSVFVDRTQARRDCWTLDHRPSPTLQCRGTVDTSDGVCCTGTRYTSGRRFPSTVDDTLLSSYRPLRSSRNHPESLQCGRTVSTYHKCLPQHISGVLQLPMRFFFTDFLPPDRNATQMQVKIVRLSFKSLQTLNSQFLFASVDPDIHLTALKGANLMIAGLHT